MLASTSFATSASTGSKRHEGKGRPLLRTNVDYRPYAIDDVLDVITDAIKRYEH